VGTRELTILSLEFPSGEAGADSGPTIADAMLAAQQELAQNPQDEADGSDDETAPAEV
jgi:hypothetical protein